MPPLSSWPGLAPAWQRAALVAWLVAVALVCALSLNPRTAPPTVAHADKAFHLLAYAALAAVAHAAFAVRGTARVAAVAMLPLGLLVEVAQDFVPGRYGDLWDALANALGVLLGLALGPLCRRVAAGLTAPRDR